MGRSYVNKILKISKRETANYADGAGTNKASCSPNRGVHWLSRSRVPPTRGCPSVQKISNMVHDAVLVKNSNHHLPTSACHLFVFRERSYT